MDEADYQIHPMTEEELALGIQWAADEGWNPGLHDAGSFYAADPSGFFLGRLGDEPVGCISAVRYGGSFGFLGFYIVRPDFRGRGLGWQLWQRAMAHVAGRNVGLDGVLEQQANYRKSGYQLAYRNVRYEGRGTGMGVAADGIVPLDTLPFATVEAYDRELFPETRTDFLRAWLSQPQSRGLASVRDGRLVGFGVIRPCRVGFKIGPLLADDSAVAEALFQALSGGVPATEPVVVDVPEPNAEATALAHRHEMKPVFETARMYTQAAPNLPLARLFGVTTFELG